MDKDLYKALPFHCCGISQGNEETQQGKVFCSGDQLCHLDIAEQLVLS